MNGLPEGRLQGVVAGEGIRGTIFVEDAAVLAQSAFPGDQYVLRVQAPACAAAAAPGMFAHIRCDPAVPMRRPLSIMRASPTAGWIEFLYKIVGEGLRHLGSRRPRDTLSVMGPIGRPFERHRERPRALLIGGGVGIPPMIFLAERLAQEARGGWRPLVLMGSEIPFPFRAQPSRIPVPGVPDGVCAAMPLLESWRVPSRLASFSDFAGTHAGYVTDLAARWLESLPDAARAEVEVFACGPSPMLAATAALARRFELPCQVALEEFMACAVGGCAGCTVQVSTADGVAMKRVCVDGPVFDACAVFGR
ncbi:MAG TPA: dihydroorotate dehydrogenase electron transfer subunit [Gammaproteobacteria bacterium]|nr:dihydroorotate dehydrogenase electron transfer subunit [Gammaproteobacteria bacterium]